MSQLVCLLVITAMSGLIKTSIIGTLVLMGFLGASQAQASYRTDYQSSLSSYLSAYSSYQITQSDYGRLGTFAAEEKYVTAMRTVLELRAETWRNYWLSLEDLLSPVADINEEYKVSLLGQIHTESDFLASYKDSLSDKKTLADLLTEALVINEKNEQYQSLAFEINTTVAAGMLKDRINEMRALNVALDERAKQQNLNEADRELVERGLSLNLERINGIETNLATKRQELLDSSGYVNEGDFSKITTNLSPIQIQLQQLLTVTDELSEYVQW